MAEVWYRNAYLWFSLFTCKSIQKVGLKVKVVSQKCDLSAKSETSQECGSILLFLANSIS